MNGFFDTVLSQLEAGQESLKTETNLIRRLERSIRLVKKAIAGLKAELRNNPFAAREEEIVYFRDQAPVIYSRLFYLIKLQLLETHRANLSPESFRKELEKEMARIEDFYSRHRQLLQSISGEASYWDNCLYTRQDYGDWWAEEEGFYIDEDFTIGSYWVSKHMANAALQKWILKELVPADDTFAETEAPGPAFFWTAKQVDFVEFVYALHLTGCLNQGKATWKETIESFGRFLGVDPGNYHVTVQEMARRKISATKFLDQLLKNLKSKLDSMG